ncbi:proton-conducting transporter membrane subunit [Ilumatobacter sp.]|uniref:proton-conducting transporter transmembrane domain-containing protein n=1 Tax=Ilumatobacter sp. TaxID=1967498 RepID=UPI003B52E0E6
MTADLVPAPVLFPLVGAAIAVTLGRRPRAQARIALVALSAAVVTSVLLLLAVRDGDVVVARIGGWTAPVGITLVVDAFAALLLTISSVVLLAVFVFAMSQRIPPERWTTFSTSYLVLAAGVGLAYTTSDLFNLFVAVEVTLVASYVLISLRSDGATIRNTMIYIVINLVASSLLIIMIAIVYAATGSVSMAELATRVGDLPTGLDSALGLLFVLVFGIKAGLFPLFFWLPDAYPTALTPVTAIFAGLLTKVGVYAIIRTQTLMFPTDGASSVLLVIAGLTMVVGVLGALAQDDIKRILSFHIVSQVGYMVMGLALSTVAGIAGAIFYMVHHIPVKTGLFLAAGLVERRGGSSAIGQLGAMRRRAPAIAALFAVPALSIAGIPPFSGFVAKLGLVRAGLDAGQGGIVAVSLAVSLLTLMSMVKIWSGVFWGEAPEPTDHDEPSAGTPTRLPGGMLGAAACVAGIVLAVGFGAGPVWDLSTTAARTLDAPLAYVEAVLGR